MSQKPLPENLHIDTLAVRAAVDRSQYGENSEALYLTSGFVQPDAQPPHAGFREKKRATPTAVLATPL